MAINPTMDLSIHHLWFIPFRLEAAAFLASLPGKVKSFIDKNYLLKLMSLVFFVQFSRSFRRRNCFTHKKQPDNTPGNQPVDKHG
jgi:hypothetical protein